MTDTTPSAPRAPVSAAAGTGGAALPAAPALPAALDARGVSKSYTLAHETIRILDGLDLVVKRGERVAVVGASGSGKTTMIHILGLLDRPDEGSLSIDGEDALLASGARRSVVRNRSIGFIFQFYHLVPELSALENVMLPARIGAGWGWFGVRGDTRDRASELLAQVGLAGRERHRPSQLSGGERQRVAIARAIMQRPHVLFCDEPTGNLDPRTARGVQDLLLSIDAADRAMVLVTHDDGFARRCDRALRLVDGRLAPMVPEPV